VRDPNVFKDVTLLKRYSLDQVWWYTSVIPATQEVVIGGSPSEAIPDKSVRPYL
jgi:hypothetical protein